MTVAKAKAVKIFVLSLFLAVAGSIVAGPASAGSALTRQPGKRNTKIRQATPSLQEQHRLNALLTEAGRQYDSTRFRQLLREGADPNQGATPKSSTWLMEYAARGDALAVEALLDHGAHVNARGRTCFAAMGHGEPDPRKSTALIDACCRSENGDVIQLLLQHGVDVNARDNSGNTPFGMAAWQCEWGECRLLLQHGARRTLLKQYQRKALSYHVRPRLRTVD